MCGVVDGPAQLRSQLGAPLSMGGLPVWAESKFSAACGPRHGGEGRPIRGAVVRGVLAPLFMAQGASAPRGATTKATAAED